MQLNEAIGMFTSLGQETRLAVFRLLVEQGPSGLAAGEISKALKVNESTLSRHLAHMEKTGLVLGTRKARHILYAVSWPGVETLLEFIVADCCKRDVSSCLKGGCCD